MSELKPFDEFMDALVHCDTVKVILTGGGESTFETKPIYEGICALAYRRAQPANEPLTRDCVEEAPAADVAEVVHGRWLINSDGYYPYCSVCKEEPKNGIMTHYCPNCGARMDGEV